ncbi:hypothetical protein, partial [Moraxella oblonga]|uniref:hypothetical protein n=1 Tax=Moraxella oblonga TaxID=200413 RepID=UPI0008309A54
MTKAETKHNAGFVAGTLAHTDKGLVPIEEIKIGDMVLSKPEFGGAISYKKVINLFETKDAYISKIEYLDNPDSESEYLLFATPEHTIWINGDSEGYGCTKIDWTRVDEIEPMSEVYLINEKLGCISWTTEIYATSMEGIGFTMDSLQQDPELLIDFRDSKNIVYYIGDLFNKAFNENCFPSKAQGTIYVKDADIYNTVDENEIQSMNFEKYPEVAKFVDKIRKVGLDNLGIFKNKVYNFEVEENHTYFVGDLGL